MIDEGYPGRMARQAAQSVVWSEAGRQESHNSSARWSSMGQLLRAHSITGNEVFDVQIVATLLQHRVSRVLSYDQSLGRFEEIEVVAPSNV